MTEYYTNKSDFENGKNLGFLENNVQQVVDLLNDISKAATIVQENDLSALYIAQGGATLGKDMPENDFTEAEHKVLKIMDALKDIHREVVQNIENKYISGLEDAMESLNKVNEGKNQYKSDHLTYQEKTTTYINNGMAGQVQTTTTRTKHFTLSDILNSDKSPIPAAAAKYSEKLRVAKERLKELEKSDKETYDKIKDVTERELVETFYPTKMGEYKRLKSTWSKDNEQWLGWVDTGIKVVGTVALIVGTVASGGLLAPASLAIGTTLLGGEAAYRAISGETITGEVLSTEQRLWAGAEAVTTLASGGIGTYMKGANLTERTVSQGLLNADKAARYGANAYDVAQFGHDFNEDPKMALTNLATSQLVGRTIGHLGNKYKAFRASKTGNVDIRSGEATSFKTNLKDRVQTAWTDIKTKTGDVKVQVGEGFDNFKNRVSNMKNRAMASGAEKVSEKLENLNAELGVRRKNFQRNLAAMQGQRELEFQLSGETPGIGVTANYSERLENLTKKIQQFSVEHRQKIQNFEGRGGGSRNVSTPHSDASSLETSNWGSDALSDLRKKWNVPETDTIAVGKTDIPGLEDRVFEGGSPKVRKEAGLPDLDEAFPDRTVRSPFNNPKARNHAEEGIFAQFEEAVQHMDPEKVKGTLKMHQSNPSGVCTSCISGITNDAAKEGIFLQFSKKYPDLKIVVTSVEREGVRKVGRLNFTIQNGKYLK